MATFRILHGTHAEGRGSDTVKLEQLKKQLGSGVIDQKTFDEVSSKLRPRRKYKTGDLIESNKDLTGPEFNGPPPMQPKFAKVMDDNRARFSVGPASGYVSAEELVQGTPHNDPLDSMTVEQLRKLAEEEEIDLGSARRKDEIIAVMRRLVAPSA